MGARGSRLAAAGGRAVRRLLRLGLAAVLASVLLLVLDVLLLGDLRRGGLR